MNPFALLAIGAGVILAINLSKTVKTATQLDYKIEKLQIYNLIKNSKITLRCILKIINPSDTQIKVNFISLNAYFKPTISDNKIVSKGSKLADVNDNKEFIIQPSGFTEKELYIEIKWVNILNILGTNIVSALISGTKIKDKFIGQNVLISGYLKAENITLPIEKVVKIGA
jgi:hypothetical protein